MKRSIALYAITAFLLFSCSAKEEGIDTATDGNLVEISSKLQSLKIDKIADQKPESDFDSESSTAFATRTPKVNIPVSPLACNHTEQINENIEGENIVSTIKYFDKNKKAISSCKTEELNEYITEEVTKITGLNYIHNFTSTTSYNQAFNLGADFSSFVYKATINSNITGTLNFDGDIFNVVDGSYFKLKIDFSAASFDFSDDFEIPLELEAVYQIEFDTKGNTYHFTMEMDENALNDSESYEGDFLLFNSADKKIGTVKYTCNKDGSNEKFELYDLVGNKI
ncbi:hypothetical protein [Wenyingzhuangia sp. IMCC45574]